VFTGRFERLLDNKGRIVVPPPLRRHLPDHCFVGAPANERCVQIFTPAQVEEVTDRLETAVREGSLSPTALRVWSSSVVESRIDSQSRLPIPQALRDQIGLDREVVMIGAVKRIELWPPDAWAEEQRRAHEEPVDMARWI
jgi:MraZ protein